MNDGGPPGEAAEVEELGERYLDQLQAGRAPDRDEIVSANPRFAAGLARRLKAIDLLHRVGQSLSTGRSAPLSARLRCPHCGHFVALEAALRPDVTCPSCGSAFKLSAGGDLPGAGSKTPERIGRFRVLHLLGRGAFGTVYKAHDDELDRPVAIKVPRAGCFASKEDEERFWREARSVARLRHAGIVQVYEIGLEAEGELPFIASEYVPSRTLAELIAENRPSFDESAALVAQIADALDFAHRQGVVHRDVKPSNVLIDPAGQPHVSDFGLARRGDEDVTVTIEGQILGTPAYMPPEQAAGEHGRVDARSDQYSLGVILYELLTGERPFRGAKTMLIYQVLHDEPRPPSRLNDHVPRDLETVCLKAMAKDPAHRYPGAAAFADDLRRFLHREPITARPVSRGERLWRWSRRNPSLACLTAAVAVLLGAVAVVSAVMAVHSARARDDLNDRLARLNVVEGFRLVAQGDLLGSLPWLTEAYRLDRGRQLREAAHGVRLESILEHCPRLEHVVFLPTSVGQADFSPDGKRAIFRSKEQATVVELETGAVRSVPIPRPESLRNFLLRRDGELLLTAYLDGRMRLWNPFSGQTVAEMAHRAALLHAAFSPSGRLLITSSDDGTSRIWEAATGKEVCAPLEHGEAVSFGGFSPDETRVVTGTAGGASRVWDLASGRQVAAGPRHAGKVHHASFSPDGRRVATAGDDRSAGVWEAATGAQVVLLGGFGHAAVKARFRPDGRQLAVASLSGEVGVWDTRTWRPVFPELRHVLGVQDAVFSPDGRRLLTASLDGTARVWDSETGREAAPPLYHGMQLETAAFSPDGRRIATGCWDGTARLWDLASGDLLAVPMRHRRWVTRASLSADGTRLVTAQSTGQAVVWDVAGGRILHGRIHHGSSVRHAVFSPDGGRIATTSDDGTARVWETASGDPVTPPLRHGRRVVHAAFGGAGNRLLATASDDGTARLWEAQAEGRLVAELPHGSPVRQVAFHPDGRILASVAVDGKLRFWSAASGKLEREVQAHALEILTLRFSPDGRRLVTASVDRTGRVWDAATGEAVAGPLRHTVGLNLAVFNPDGRVVATACADGTARLWGVESGEPLVPELKHRAPIQDLAFSPDGRLVATGSFDTTAIVWDTETGEQITPLLVHQEQVLFVGFTADGRSLITVPAAEHGGGWKLPERERPVADRHLLAHLLAGRRVDGVGGSVRLDVGELRQAWGALRPRYPEDFTAAPGDVVGWHRREAAACLDAGLWSSALVHLVPLVEAEPEDPMWREQRAHAHGSLGDYARAAADYAALRVVAGGLDRYPFLRHALALLGANDAAGAREIVRAAVERFRDTGDALQANMTAWLCGVMPGAVSDYSVPVALARRATAAQPQNGAYRNTLAAVLYRAGELDEARGHFEAAIAIENRIDIPTDWAFLAMIHARQGRAGEARRALENARSALVEFERRDAARSPSQRYHWHQWLEARLLTAEAEAVAGK